MGLRTPEDVVPETPPVLGPPLAAAAALAAVLFLLLTSNGRPIEAGDTRVNAHAAASLVLEGDLDLDEYPELREPFATKAGERWVSIYPALTPVLAAPVFAAARLLFALDEDGTALAGKAAASLLTALASGALFLAVGRRRPLVEAAATAAVFALGTSAWSTSQALWQHPAALLVLCWALLWIVRAEEDEAWAARAALPLSLAVAARHADVALAAALALALALRWPRRIPAMLLWGAPGAALVLLYQWIYFGSPLRHGFPGALGRFSEPWGVGHLGLLVSPAKGLLVFTPVVVVAAAGLVRAFRRGERWLAGTMAAGAAAHWLLVGRWSEWHGGECWGPRMMTDALPLLFLFLPEGLDLLRWPGRVLAALSIAVQALGAFAYDYRWEYLHQRPPSPGRPELWRLADSPIAFHLRERVLLLSLPALSGGRVYVREHRAVPFSPRGSQVHFADGPAVTGSPATLGEVHLLRGARIEGGRLQLRGRRGLFLRVQPAARLRRLALVVAGRGRGTLHVGERSFWAEKPRWTPHPVSGSFRVRHPYFYPESGGGDVVLTLAGEGEVELDSVALLPAGDSR